MRVRARPSLTGSPAPRASRAAAAAPQLHPRPGPARPPAHRPPPRMELSAIGEQVFAVESIRKKRVRKVRLLGGGSRDAARSPPAPQHRPPPGRGRGRAESSAGGTWGPPRAARAAAQPAAHFARRRRRRCRRRGGPARVKVVAPGCWCIRGHLGWRGGRDWSVSAPLRPAQFRGGLKAHVEEATR